MDHKFSRRVVVTGYGAVSSLGNSVDEIWNSIMHYRVGYQRETFSDPNIVAKYFGFIHNTPSTAKFPKSLTKCLPEFAKLGLVAADEAVAMAFGEKGNLDDFYDPFERGLIFGTGWAGQDALLSANESYRQDNWASPFSNLMAMPSVATAAISKHWNLRGYQNTPVTTGFL